MTRDHHASLTFYVRSFIYLYQPISNATVRANIDTIYELENSSTSMEQSLGYLQKNLLFYILLVLCFSELSHLSIN